VLVLLVAALGTSILIGRLAGGRLRHLGRIRLTAAFLASAGLVVMVVLSVTSLGEVADRIALGAGYALLGAFLAVNVVRHRGAIRIGLAVLALGWGMNTLVIAANGGMPLSLSAYRASGQIEAPTPGQAGFFKLVVADEHSALRPLGDVIPVKPIRNVVSAGDLMLIAGMAVFVAAGMRAQPRRAHPVAPSLPRWSGAPPRPTTRSL
jgi:hypothetical protein